MLHGEAFDDLDQALRFLSWPLELRSSCWSAVSSLLFVLNRLPHMDELIKSRSAMMSQQTREL